MGQVSGDAGRKGVEVKADPFSCSLGRTGCMAET